MYRRWCEIPIPNMENEYRGIWHIRHFRHDSAVPANFLPSCRYQLWHSRQHGRLPPLLVRCSTRQRVQPCLDTSRDKILFHTIRLFRLCRKLQNVGYHGNASDSDGTAHCQNCGGSSIQRYRGVSRTKRNVFLQISVLIRAFKIGNFWKTGFSIISVYLNFRLIRFWKILRNQFPILCKTGF